MNDNYEVYIFLNLHNYYKKNVMIYFPLQIDFIVYTILSLSKTISSIQHYIIKITPWLAIYYSYDSNN